MILNEVLAGAGLRIELAQDVGRKAVAGLAYDSRKVE